MQSNALGKISIVISIIALIVAGAALFLVLNPLGQMNTNGSGSTEISQSSDTQSGGLFVSNEWPECSATADVPVPQFSAKPSEVKTTNDGMATIDYDKLAEQEVMTFIEQLKQAEFIYDIRETRDSASYSYSASNKSDAISSFTGTNISISYQNTGTTHISITNYKAFQNSLRDNSTTNQH